MKYLKDFRLFESVWSPEEFVDEVRRGLSKYNLSSVEVRELLKRVDIEEEIEMGHHPNILIDQLVNDLDLKSLGTSGYTSWRVPKSWQSQVKYF